MHDHIRDKRDHNHRDVTLKVIEEASNQTSTDVQAFTSTRTGWHCKICDTFSTTIADVVAQQCFRIERSDVRSWTAEGEGEMDIDRRERIDHPDRIAHTLATNEGEPVRISLRDDEATIPTGPCFEGSPPTKTVQCPSFDAVVDVAEIEDAGETLWVRLHVSESEWRRIGLGKHWDADNAVDDGAQRYLDVTGSRFDNYDTYDETVYTAPVPDTSPVLTTYNERPRGTTTAPPAPFDLPDVRVDAVTAERVRNHHNVWTRVDVGTITAVTPLD